MGSPHMETWLCQCHPCVLGTACRSQTSRDCLWPEDASHLSESVPPAMPNTPVPFKGWEETHMWKLLRHRRKHWIQPFQTEAEVLLQLSQHLWAADGSQGLLGYSRDHGVNFPSNARLRLCSLSLTKRESSLEAQPRTLSASSPQ